MDDLFLKMENRNGKNTDIDVRSSVIFHQGRERERERKHYNLSQIYIYVVVEKVYRS